MRLKNLPTNIWFVGFSLLFSYMSAWMITGAMPLYITTVLGGTGVLVGFIEGFGLFCNFVAKLFSGYISDYVKDRRKIALIGTALAALSRPFYAFGGIGVLTLSRFADRLSQGIYKAPSDALIGDLAPKDQKGASYGLRESLARIGSLIGTACVIIILQCSTDNFSLIFWLATIPSLLAVYFLFRVHAPELSPRKKESVRLQWSLAKRFPKKFWLLLLIVMLFMSTRFSEAFIVLSAANSGLAKSWAPAVLILIDFCCALAAYPSGVIADKLGKRFTLTIALLSLSLAHFIIYQSVSFYTILLACLFWGAQSGIILSSLNTIVVDLTPKELRGTAFGLLHITIGIGMLFANLLAGYLSDHISKAAPYFYGSIVAAFSALIILFFLQSSKTSVKEAQRI